MATVAVEVTIDLSDYFSKFGFGDGDDGAARRLGWDWSDRAVKIVNEELKKAGSKAKARLDDNGWSLHNDLRITIDIRGQVCEIGADAEFVTFSPDAPEKEIPAIKKAYQRAYKRFDRELLKEEGKWVPTRRRSKC